MKPKNALSLLAGMFSLILVLAACSSGPEANMPTPGSDTALISVSIPSRDLAPSELGTFGVPYDDDGLPAVETVQIWVYPGGSNMPVRFSVTDGVYIASSTGVTHFIELTADGTSRDVQLPVSGNNYRFVAMGYSAPGPAPTAPLIAFGETTQAVFDDSRVAIMLESIIGSASLSSRLPLEAVVPGMAFDLMLHVFSPDHGAGSPFNVPLVDFEIVDPGYGIDAGTEISSSKRGVRVQVDECAPDDHFTVDVTVYGITSVYVGQILDPETDIPSGEELREAVRGDVETILEIQCYVEATTTGSSVFTDLTPPEVTIEGYGIDHVEISGTASDNLGVAKVQLYDGPVLVASTDLSDLGPQAPSQVAPITFDDSNRPMAFTATLTAPSSSSLIAYAWDYWGNQSASIETVNPNYLYVDTCRENPGDGSEAFPFNSLYLAVDTVWAGGTINVADNDVCGPENLDTAVALVVPGVSIIGAGHGLPAETLKGDTEPSSSFVGSGFDVRAAGVTLSGLHLSAAPTSPFERVDPLTGYVFIRIDADSTGTIISHNVITAEGSVNSDVGFRTRGIGNGPITRPDLTTSPASALISDNYFTGLITGVFANPGAEFTLLRNRFEGNAVGSANDGGGTAIRSNVFSGNSAEGIGLLADGYDIRDNCFAALSGSAVHVRAHLPSTAILTAYIPVNQFEIGSAAVAANSLVDLNAGTPHDCG